MTDSTVIYNLLQNFVIGGLAVAITSYLGTFLSPLAGAIFWAYPITILPSIFFMKENGKNNKEIGKFLFSTTFALILLMAVTLALSYLIKNAPEKQSLWIAVGKSTGVFLLGSAIYFGIIKAFKLQKYFM